jgi:hypothetical protein
MSMITAHAGDVATLPAPTVVAPSVADLLREPFAPEELKFKPQVVKGDRALAVVYVDARTIQERLDRVFGPAGWSTRFTPLADGTVMCDLSCRFDGEWVTKGDVGSPSEQPDAGDRMKASFSDALKRAAVHFGLGRYLYRLGGQWLAYNAKTKEFIGVPRLPAWALPYAQQGRGRPEKNRENSHELNGHATNGTAPKELPAAATPTTPAMPERRGRPEKNRHNCAELNGHANAAADRRWQDLNALARRYAGLLSVPTDQVLRDLRRACHIDGDTPYAALTAEQWTCLEGKLRGAIQKRAGAEG